MESTVYLSGGVISDNTSKDIGGISVYDGKITVTGGKVINNSSKSGAGGISASFSTMNISNGIISNNSGGTGGGAEISYGTFIMTGGEISQNSAEDGGGIGSDERSKMKISGGSITDNTAVHGGGIYADCILELLPNPNPVLDLYPDTNCLSMDGGIISNNTATYGGGIYLNDGDCIASISGGTISDNTAETDGDGIYVTKGDILNLSSDAFINKNNDVYLDGTNTAVNVLSKLNKITRENPIALTPSDTTTVSTTTGVVGNKLVNYFAKASALEADMQDYFILSDYVSTDAHIVQSDFTSEENYLILGKRMVSLFLKFSGIVGAENETISLTKNDIITKSPAYQAVIAKYAKKGYTLEFYFDENHTNLLPADQAIVDDTTLYAQYVKNPNTLDNVAIYAIIGIATVAGASVLLKSQKRSRR